MIPRPRIDRQQQLRDDNAADEDDVLCDERPSVNDRLKFPTFDLLKFPTAGACSVLLSV